jgi:3',5'-cyclic AMP phosphodiesterase CpdA
MKFAILSDIHGNLPALQAVAAHIEAWQPDHTIVNGDIVNLGPDSVECWQFIETKQRSANWQITQGNHEANGIKEKSIALRWICVL